MSLTSPLSPAHSFVPGPPVINIHSFLCRLCRQLQFECVKRVCECAHTSKRERERADAAEGEGKGRGVERKRASVPNIFPPAAPPSSRFPPPPVPPAPAPPVPLAPNAGLRLAAPTEQLPGCSQRHPTILSGPAPSNRPVRRDLRTPRRPTPLSTLGCEHQNSRNPGAPKIPTENVVLRNETEGTTCHGTLAIPVKARRLIRTNRRRRPGTRTGHAARAGAASGLAAPGPGRGVPRPVWLSGVLSGWPLCGPGADAVPILQSSE